MKKQEIRNGDWDYLIVLDACRYDEFQRFYDEYLEGNLSKRISRGSCTAEWLHETFTEPRRDTVYVSANPYINGYNLPLRDLYTPCRSHWTANAYFKEVVDAWDFSWDEDLSTVHPHDLNRVVINKLKRLGKDRMIVHYIQPHRPYLNADFQEIGLGRDFARKKKTPKKLAILPKILMPFWNLLPVRQKAMIKKYLHLKNTFWQKVYLDGTIDKVKKYYRDNLRIVLGAVSELILNLSGKIIITSDHGEAFGEKGEFGHPPKTHIPSLVEVPWFKVEGSKREKEKEFTDREKNLDEKSKSEEEEIKKKLSSLGY